MSTVFRVGARVRHYLLVPSKWQSVPNHVKISAPRKYLTRHFQSSNIPMQIQEGRYASDPIRANKRLLVNLVMNPARDINNMATMAIGVNGCGGGTKGTEQCSKFPSLISVGKVASAVAAGITTAYTFTAHYNTVHCSNAIGTDKSAETTNAIHKPTTTTANMNDKIADDNSIPDGTKNKPASSQRNPLGDSFAALGTNPQVRDAMDTLSKYVGGRLTILIDTGIPAQLTAGFVAGYCMGFAMKKSFKVVAVVLGFALLCMQSLSYAGYVRTDWTEISEDFIKWLDTNGDGRIDREDMKVWWERASKIVGFNLPAGSGWVAGWIAGLRTG